jgi:hypothetical protein
MTTQPRCEGDTDHRRFVPHLARVCHKAQRGPEHRVRLGGQAATIDIGGPNGAQAPCC